MVKTDIALENLKGFIKKGARAKNRGFVPTGHFSLDFAIKYGRLSNDVDLNSLKDYDPATPLGLPLGRIVELFGAEASGKSSLAYRVCGYGQKLGLPAAWIDTEHSFEEELAELNGLDVDNLYYSSLYDDDDPDKNFFAEDILDNMVDLSKNGMRIIVLDSVANLIPRQVDEDSAEKQNIAKLARLLSGQIGKLAHYAAKHNVLIIFINQIREKPGVMFGSPETTPGGRALKFNSSVRVKMTKRSTTDSIIFVDDEDETDGKRIIGRYSGVVLEKNRMGPPFLDAKGKAIVLDIPVYYKPYFPDLAERLFDSGRQLKIISVRKGVFTWGDVKIEGRKAFIEQLKSNGSESKLLKELKDFSAENKTLLPPEVMLANTDEKHVPRTRKKDDSKVSTANAA